MDIDLNRILQNQYAISVFSQIDCTLDDLYRFYGYYFENLKVISRIQQFSLEFKEIDDIIVPKEIAKGRFMVREDFVDRSILAFGKELEANGTYWPFILFDQYLQEGVHRVTALKQVKSCRKWLCWSFPVYLLSEKLLEPIPIYFLFPFFTFESLKLLKIFSNVKMVEKNVYLVSIANYGDLYRLMVLFSKYFSTHAIRFRNEFKPSLIINSEKTFNDWRVLK